MKPQFSLFLLTLIIGLSGCASHKKINKQAREIDCHKTILFVYEKASDSVIIGRKGFSAGSSPYPDYEKTLQKSIEELNKHTKANLLFENTAQTHSDSVIQVKVLIKAITWSFGFSTALMETNLMYQVDDENINIVGTNKVYLAGTKTGNLFKSLKDGNYQLLKKICGPPVPKGKAP